MDFRAGREENLRRWFCAFGRKQENKHWHWAGIVTSMTDIMTLPLMLVLCLQQCVSLGYHLTKVVATESFWSKGTQGLTQFFLLRVKRTLNSDLLFFAQSDLLKIQEQRFMGGRMDVTGWPPEQREDVLPWQWWVVPRGTAQAASPGRWKSLFLWLNRHCFSYNQLPA